MTSPKPSSTPLVVYAVTTYRRTTNLTAEERYSARTRRTVGVFATLAEARKIVSYNRGDLEESGYYAYAVIESVPMGLYALDREQWWYVYAGGNRWRRLSHVPPDLDAAYPHLANWSDIG